MLNTVLAHQFGCQLASALGRPATDSEVAMATALVSLRRAEGVSLLRIDGVMDRTGLGRSVIYKLASQNRFPKSVQIQGARVAVWASDEISCWVAAQLRGEDK